MLTTKSDIYSFGILLLRSSQPVEEALVFTQLALKCANYGRRTARSGEEILPELNRLRTLGQEYEAAQMDDEVQEIPNVGSLPKKAPKVMNWTLPISAMMLKGLSKVAARGAKTEKVSKRFQN
ncbi:hypothetical protein ZWY2020_054855 [Hordeum vulgare]|nr:hypothetical protein ZWY2020_054855 [Hordeum vulgare]